MIRPVESVPTYGKAKCKRNLLKADIEEAWEKGIKAFEFTGYPPEEKYLANNAREAAEYFFSGMIRDVYSRAYEQLIGGRNRWHHRPRNFSLWREIATISTRTIDGTRHVYCEFHHTKEDFEEFIRETARKDKRMNDVDAQKRKDLRKTRKPAKIKELIEEESHEE